MELQEPKVISTVKGKLVTIVPMSEKALEVARSNYDDFNKEFVAQIAPIGKLEMEEVTLSSDQADALGEDIGNCFSFDVHELIEGKTYYLDADNNKVPHKGSSHRIEMFENRKPISTEQFDKINDAILMKMVELEAEKALA